MCWVKTISNAWTTSHRMHEIDRWACIFGCSSCEDTLTHYLACPLLLSLVHEICSTPFGPSIAHRLGLIDPSLVHIHMIAMCFSVYHTLKGGFKNMIIEAFRCHLFANVHLQARKIANDCFHSYEIFVNQARPGSRQIGYHRSLLASRFSALRSDPSLVEVAPGVFSRAVDPLSRNSRSVLDSVDLSLDGCRRQR
jgi:hypothetical protein